MNENIYIVATIRPWNIQVFQDTISHYPGTWHLITENKQLTPARIKKLKPKYIFFPHWNHLVPVSIMDLAECVCFHETDVPYGRGGSPIQNLIARGCKETKITALKMTQELDAGPVYLKKPLALDGLAEEIFIRASRLVAQMIREIITHEPLPQAQQGKIVKFQRRTPEQSKAPVKLKNLNEMFDHLRMLDAEEYPKGFIEHGGFRYEFSRPALRTGAIEADVRITPLKAGGRDDLK